MAAGGSPSHSSDLRIVLLGKSGSEISCVGNMILGRQAFKENIRESEIQRGRVEDRQMSVIITPGFFNPQLTDEDQQNDMMKSLSLSHPGPHVLLIIFKPNTFPEDVKNIIEKIEKNPEAHVFKFTRVLFIREHMSNRDWIDFSLTENFKELIRHFRGEYYVMNTESGKTQTTRLLEKLNEFVKGNKNQHYIDDNYVTFVSRIKQERKMNVPVMQTEHKLPLTPQVPPRITRPHEKKTSRPRDRTPSFTSQVTPRMIRKHENKTQRPQDLRIVMLGSSGNGRSATGNTILGRDVFKVEMSCESVTRLSETHQNMVNDRNISVTDTPGLLDASISTEKLNTEMVNCIFMSAPGPHVFLLVIRLDVKFTDERNDTVKWIQAVFSEDAMNFTMVLFTRGDQLDKPIEDFLKKNKQLKGLVDRCKAGYHVFNNKEKNQRQVTELLEKIDRLIQKNGGQHYTNELYQKAQRQLDQKARKRENPRQREERRYGEEELRNREKELKIREEQLRRREEEQRKREEEEKQRRIDIKMKANKVISSMSMRRREVDKMRLLAAFMAAQAVVSDKTPDI